MRNVHVSVWILGDQLLEQHPALAMAQEQAGKECVRIVLVESTERLRQLPYQRRKLVLLLSAMRHYAELLRAAGYSVDYVRSDTFIDGLRQHCDERHPTRLFTMGPPASTIRAACSDNWRTGWPCP